MSGSMGNRVFIGSGLSIPLPDGGRPTPNQPEVYTVQPPGPPLVRPIQRWELSAAGKTVPFMYSLINGRGAMLLMGAEGLADPPVEMQETVVPTWDGTTLQDPVYGAREIFLPIHFVEPTHELLRERLQVLRDVTNTRINGLTRLTCFRNDGTQFWIEGARRVGRGEGDWAPQLHGTRWRTVSVVLRCPEPWWNGTQIRAIWRNSTSVSWFPITPLRLSTSTLVNAPVTIVLSGDAPAYPLWTITGPMTSITATRMSDGAKWQLTHTLSAGQTATVDTNPRNTRVLNQAGTSIWSSLVPPHFNMWALNPGNNVIQVEMSGMSTATKVEMTATPRFATVL